jgi:hypothetical protein
MKHRPLDQGLKTSPSHVRVAGASSFPRPRRSLLAT